MHVLLTGGAAAETTEKGTFSTRSQKSLLARGMYHATIHAAIHTWLAIIFWLYMQRLALMM